MTYLRFSTWVLHPLWLVAIFSACTKKDTHGLSPAALDRLKKEDVIVGTGTEAKDGKDLTIHYEGWLADGKKFESSVERNKPYTFRLGSGEAIKGWDYGIAGMKVGGKRKLTVPPELAYGAKGAGETVPPDATLTYEIQLLSVD